MVAQDNNPSPDIPPACYDVVVLGGGPAGTTVATLLQQHGHRCVILEGAVFPRYHIGESLIPNTYGVFERLGLLPVLRASAFPVKHSVRFVSPSGTEHAPFYFFETIPGERAHTWQVERSEFDRMCVENARRAGAAIHFQSHVERVLFDGSRAYGVRVSQPEGPSREYHGRVIVDATGRATVLGKQLGLRGEIPGLNKAALWTYFRGGYRRDGMDAGETTVFMLPGRGWFWYIPLPKDLVSVGIVAAPESLFDRSGTLESILTREIENCGPLREWLSKAERMDTVRSIRKLAYLNRQVAGDGWLMVGDAAGFLDPVYSSGLFLALASGELAADAIHDALTSNDLSAARLGSFVPQLWAGVEVIHRLIRAFYDPNFSFRDFARAFPDQKANLIDCLIGDVVGRDLDSFLDALATMTPPPAPLHQPVASHSNQG